MSVRVTTTYIPPPEDWSREAVITAFLRGEVGHKTIVQCEEDSASDWYPFELLSYEPTITRWWSDTDDWQANWTTYVVLPQEGA